MKRYTIILLIILTLVFTFMFISHTQNLKDLKYAIEFHVTKSFFNKNKLENIDNFIIEYSDANAAIVTITGTSSKSPNKTLTYNLILSKNKKGIWKIIKTYFPNSSQS